MTRISPAAAVDASRAVVFTTSPSAVKSSTAPAGPVVPTYASPVCTPAPIGIGPVGDASGRPSRRHELDGRFNRGVRMARTRDPTEEQPDDLVADQLVDEPVVAEDDLRADPVEAVEEAAELRRSHALGDPVEPRTSANSRLTGISAPVSPFLRNSLMQFAQIAGLPGKRAKPMRRKTAPPTPSNGAAHSLQRGEDGKCLTTFRKRAMPGSSPVRTFRNSSSGTDCDMTRTIRRRRGGPTRLTA